MEHSNGQPDVKMETRRDFLKMTASLPLAVSLSGGFLSDKISGPIPSSVAGSGILPWYQRTYRWGQINLNESDPQNFDLDWWRGYWKRTQTQGLVINAGGIVAFYPSKEPLQHQAEFLNGHDLYGDLTRAAHADGLIVFARMDCGSAFEPFYHAHPDWFAVNAAGEPYRGGSAENGVVLYTTCINGPYYDEYIPRILREVIAHEKPEGFT
ncbi:MAG: Tat pathway signal protein, partial [Acidobacteriaceae bacterium]